MPSHRVHREVAAACTGLGLDVVSRVDRLVDLGVLHDLGRRMPRRPPAYLLVFEEYERNFKNKIRKINKILNNILYDDTACKAFYLHHALDMHSMRLAMAIALGIENRTLCNSLAESVVECQVIPIARTQGGVCLNELESFLKNALSCSCSVEGLWAWSRSISDSYKPLSPGSIELDKLNKYLKNIFNLKIKYDSHMFLGLVLALSRMNKINRNKIIIKINDVELEIELNDEDSVRRAIKIISTSEPSSNDQNPLGNKYAMGMIRRRIVELASRYSGLYNLIYLTYCPKIYYDMYLSVSKRKYSKARDILKCYAMNINDLNIGEECAVEHAREILENLELLDGVKLGHVTMNSVLEMFIKYIRIFIENLLLNGVNPLIDY